MKTRKDQYKEFQYRLMRLLGFAIRNDIVFKGLEWWRSQQEANRLAAMRLGSRTSKHLKSLAVDIILVTESGRNVLYVKDLSGKGSAWFTYLKLGEFWESIGGVWGGRFLKNGLPDVYHFEHPEKPL